MRIVKQLTALVVLVFAVAVVTTSAQQSQTGSGLSISPTLSEFTLKPGEADTVDITLKNITVGDIIAQAYLNDFAADNETGSPKIIVDPNKQSPNSIKNFVVDLDDVPLAKGEQKKINVLIQVPASTTPGAYFGVIRYKAVPANDQGPKEGEVSLSASVGTIVLVTVPGTITEQVELTGLHIYQGDKEALLFTKQPNEAGVEIKNLGNGFVKPYGTVEIRNMFGEVAYSYQLNNNNPRANILPGSSRIFKDEIRNINKFGRYTMSASVTYGNGSEILVMEKTFWYLPLWLIAVIVAIVIALIAGLLWAFRSYRRSSKHGYHRK